MVVAKTAGGKALKQRVEKNIEVPKGTRTTTDVLVVREGASITWPDGSFRGSGPNMHNRMEGRNANGCPQPMAYAVSAEDPFIQDAGPGTLGNLLPAPVGTKPVPQDRWPKRWVALAAEKREKMELRTKRELARAQAEKDAMELEIPDPDEGEGEGSETSSEE